LIHHIDFVVSDFERSLTFYTAALAPLNMPAVMHRKHATGRRVTGFGHLPDPVFYIRNFWINEAKDPPGRLHVAFNAPSRAAVDEFHAAALAYGGQDYGPPGLRPQYADHYYSAYVLDPDGHNIEAVCRLPE
jgi:catechol 2,3-dioxygenase-like lactoylglutathione lyase family enzyme